MSRLESAVLSGLKAIVCLTVASSVGCRKAESAEAGAETATVQGEQARAEPVPGVSMPSMKEMP